MIPRLLPAVRGAVTWGWRTSRSRRRPIRGVARSLPLAEFPAADRSDVEQVGDRRHLLRSFDNIRRDVDNSGQLTALDRYGQQAWEILTSNAARNAFDIDSEPRHIRERYGFMPAFDPGAANRCGAPAWSQRILLARRLVEAGVRLVTVDVLRDARARVRFAAAWVPAPLGPGLFSPPRRPGAAWPARIDPRSCLGRVRPHAARQQ